MQQAGHKPGYSKKDEAMGWDITFRNSSGEVGSVHFAGMAANRQTKAYGLCFYDCLTYGATGEDTEAWGSIRSKADGPVGWWRPRTKRCVERAERLLAAVKAKPTHPQDEERCAELHRLLVLMASDRSMVVTLSG